MESVLTDILNLIHTREKAIESELKTLSETKRLLLPKGQAKDTQRLSPANLETDADTLPEVTNRWSAARRARHSRMMKKRWQRKRAKQ